MKKELLMGNHAIVKGALKAGMKFFSAYPITPASEIMHYMALEKDIEFVHAEDEIAAINMVIGATLAGRKSMTATSGPGFSLKQEGIGFAHKIEVPLVVVDVQRVGPSTGMPTLPSQGDIMQARYGSHGDYYPIVFYPNSVEECYKYTIEAFNCSEESHSPVILLSDSFLSHLHETVNIKDIKVNIKNRKLKSLGTGKRHFTGLISKNGIPKTKDSEYYNAWIKDIKKRRYDVAKNYSFFEYIKNKKSNTLIIAYGFTSRVIMQLKEKYSIFRPIRIFPMLENELIKISKNYKNIVVIEMNDGKYKNEVERVLKRNIELISVFGGSISIDYINKELKKIK